MDIHITKDEKKPLLKKREILGQISYEGKTPARLEIRKELAKKLGAKEELVLVKRAKTNYGSQTASLEAEVYEDEATMKAVEQNYMLERHGQGEKKEEKKEEAPAEQK